MNMWTRSHKQTYQVVRIKSTSEWKMQGEAIIQLKEIRLFYSIFYYFKCIISVIKT